MLEPVGVAATRDIDEIAAQGADCALHMPARCDFDEVCRLFDVMGFGTPPAAFDERRPSHLRDAFGPSLQLAPGIRSSLDLPQIVPTLG